MTVKELIKMLQELPEDSEVIVFNDRLQKDGYYNVDSICNNHMGKQIELTLDYSERV
jgi:hypothetical protein